MQPIVIAAGGTGGHFFPAEALAAELVARGHRIVLMTDRRSGGLNSPVFKDREQYILRGAGIAGRGVWRGVKAIGAMAAGVAQARGILMRIGAGSVVGFGGYPSVAPVLAASLLRQRPPVILHEQNAVLGRANRFLARRADVLALGFARTERIPSGTRTEFTGNPVRPTITRMARSGADMRPARSGIDIRPAGFGAEAASYGAATGAIKILVLGGSLGARVFSDIVPGALRSLPETLRARLSVVQQTRAEDLQRVKAAYGESGIPADLSPFFPDVAAHLMEADLVIARAGASTVAELAIAGRPAILVPLPGAIDDHQSANARALAQAGAAWVVPQPRFTVPHLTARLVDLLSDPAALAAAAVNARTQARPDAASRLADVIETCMTPAHPGGRA